MPSEEAHIRLGDVVVSRPHKGHSGVVQYDSGKATPGGFVRTGSLNSPPTILLSAVAKLEANHLAGKWRLGEHLCKLEGLSWFKNREAAGPDTLFSAMYNHKGGDACEQCDKSQIIHRESRGQEVVVHYGTIASGNQVMRSAAERDKVNKELDGVLCFEMEAAGLMNGFPCLVIRGISDYADSHKNKMWQPYAAATAASYAKELLATIPLTEVVKQRTVHDDVSSSGGSSHSTKSDLNTALGRLAYRKNKRLNWQESVVDLLEVLDLRCTKAFQEWLSKKLRVHVGLSGSKKQNDALRKAVVEKLASNEVEWQDIMECRQEGGRCRNCGYLRHREYQCTADCGRCMTIVSFNGF